MQRAVPALMHRPRRVVRTWGRAPSEEANTHPMPTLGFMLDAVPLWAALPPLGLYLLALGRVHLRRQPTAVSGAWDFMCAAASMAGFAVVGPLALVAPATAGPSWTMLMFLLVFGLLAAIGVLASRPRVVVYNITLDQLRPVVAEVTAGLDASARWAGETAALPGRDLQIHLDGRGSMRTVSVIAVGSRTSPEGWTEFSRRLRQAVRRLRVRPSPWAAVFLAAGMLVLTAAGWLAVRDRLATAGATPAATDAVRPAAVLDAAKGMPDARAR